MAIPMTTLRRAANGDWFSRKAIPDDVRESYRLAFGKSQEERFRRPATLPQARAVAELRDWDAEISGRIDALRAAREGRGRDLTHREAHALAGAWYSWFIAEHEEEPGEAEGWELLAEQLDNAYSRFAPLGSDLPDADPGWMDKPAVRRHVRAVLAGVARVPAFLAERGESLSDEAGALFLDTLEEEFAAALALLRRRSEGDYRADPRPARFPAATPPAAPTKPSGMNSMGLFAGWVKERQPAVSTVSRWRSVFLAMDERFTRRDAGRITEAEAREWADTLVTEERSAAVANDIWLRAANVVFGWAAGKKLISTNPFDGITLARPKAEPKLREREFQESEWKVILKATLEKPKGRLVGHKAAVRRWVPWLCAYTGSRPGEVTQLRGADVRQHSQGFWFIRITPEAGTVKGGTAREVPLHPHLIEQGFLEFVQEVGEGPLFYDPTATRVAGNDPTKPARPPWVIARQKLGDWVRGLGIDDKGISPNHAWRHTFKRRAARAGLERRIRNAFCGHSSSDVGDQYETPTLEDMAAEVGRFPRYVLGTGSQTGEANGSGAGTDKGADER